MTADVAHWITSTVSSNSCGDVDGQVGTTTPSSNVLLKQHRPTFTVQNTKQNTKGKYFSSAH